jgi:hypothetical protein
LCSAVVPAFAFEFPAKNSSFAYRASHPSSYAPFHTAALPIPASAAPAAATEPQPPSRDELCRVAAFEAALNKLPLRFFANLIETESNFRPHIVSHKGAQGIAQFMPGTADEQGLRNPFDPIPALSASAKFMAYLLGRFGNLGLAAAAYNAGPQRVSEWLAKQDKLPEETQNYVRRITGIAVEEWARPGPNGTDIRLPPYSECPQFRTAETDSLVSTKIKITDVGHPRGSGRRRGGKYNWWSRLSGLTYVVLTPSVSRSASKYPSVRASTRTARRASR